MGGPLDLIVTYQEWSFVKVGMILIGVGLANLFVAWYTEAKRVDQLVEEVAALRADQCNTDEIPVVRPTPFPRPKVEVNIPQPRSGGRHRRVSS